MRPVLERVASALVLTLSSSCFSPGADTNTTDPASSTGSSGTAVASASEATGVSTGVGTDTGPTGTTTTSDPTTTTNPSTTTTTTSTTGDSSTGTTMAPASCIDSMQDGDETDVDCGGSCAPCEATLGCLVNADCLSNACLNQECLADPECLDVSNCPAAAACVVASCVDFACQQAPAGNGAACDDGKVCTADEACKDMVCEASTPKMVALVDLPNDPSMGLYFDGTKLAGLAGSSVGDAGDFNGDGLADLYVVETKPNGRVYVLFGGPTLADTTLTDAENGVGGVMIDVDIGVTPISVAGAGDVNDDGFADLVIGTPMHPKTGGFGGAYVIQGRAATMAIKINSMPAGVGLLVGPPVVNNRFGTAVAGLGDINGDGLDDFAVTALNMVVGNVAAGSAFVVYGMVGLHKGNVQQDYVTLGKAIRIDGPNAGVSFGNSVAGVGDFNKDGRRDLAVGQSAWSAGRGRAYVLYTPANPASFQLETDPNPLVGLAMAGSVQAFDYIGTTVAGAGDFNDDGYADVIVGTGASLRKVLVVYGGVYGGASTADMLVMTNNVSVIGTPGPGFVGPAVAGGRDVNGDGVDDVVIGANDSGPGGEVYVAFGTAKGVPVAPRTVADLIAGKGGFAIAGAGMTGKAGASVALVPSVNDDELADVLIGAPGFDVTRSNNEGRAYVLHGGDCSP